MNQLDLDLQNYDYYELLKLFKIDNTVAVEAFKSNFITCFSFLNLIIYIIIRKNIYKHS